MPSSKADLLLHPLRLQIITAIASQQKTAKEIAQIIPEVPLTTLYRHINSLLAGGLLKVVGETQVRGTIERTYALAVQPSLNADDLHGMTKQEYQQAFLIYLSSLLGAAEHYLESKEEGGTFNPLDDGVELSLGNLMLSDEEFQRMNQRILEVMIPMTKNPPAPNRKRRFFTYLFIPQD
jgi:DNA-binding transcriptional ArsR family regulator